MTKDKRNDSERETKAGLMEKNEAVTETASERTPTHTEGTPKISKDEAEQQDRKRPLH